ncbi:MAG: hypothetical protein E6Q97_19410 [Desulfurellales bacterium]|nr:MAG: hypothetical protein E6Q97_19410 [Desulfurellales bacterium]
MKTLTRESESGAVMPDRAVVEHTPIPVTLTREQANEMLEQVVERLAEELSEAQGKHGFDPDDPYKMTALRNVVNYAKLAGDLL